jgi:hypothetical protein
MGEASGDGVTLEPGPANGVCRDGDLINFHTKTFNCKGGVRARSAPHWRVAPRDPDVAFVRRISGDVGCLQPCQRTPRLPPPPPPSPPYTPFCPIPCAQPLKCKDAEAKGGDVNKGCARCYWYKHWGFPLVPITSDWFPALP